MEEALLVFLRWPEPGRTKTRLVPALGEEGAAELYRRMAERVAETVRAVDRPGLERIAFFEPADRAGAVSRWLGPAFRAIAQPETDLGGRLRAGFDAAFAEGAVRVAAIGTDCVEVTAAHLEDAFDRLKETDAVLGPAVDGGYWLIGLAAPCPEAFERIPWSTSDTAGATEQALARAHRRLERLATLRDIDRPEDLELVKDLLP